MSIPWSMNDVTTPLDKLRANGDKLTGQYWGDFS